MGALSGILLLALLLAGCAQTVYRHPDYSAQRWNRDSYECERDRRQSWHGRGLVGQLAADDFYDRCLRARGWTKTQE